MDYARRLANPLYIMWQLYGIFSNMRTKNLNQLPIGVFDSGIGGLTVLKALQKHLPNESFLYLGDTARLPYGTKSPDTVIQYAIHANKILINRGIKFLVVACNTATAHALPALQATFTQVPVIGVIEPGAQAACTLSRNGHIAVIATEGTVNTHSYQNAIKKLRPDATVHAKGCSLFVSLAEEGWTEGPIVEAVAQRYLEPIFNENRDYDPDVLVLGCTHFPILVEPIKKIIGDKIAIIDSGVATAEIVVTTLKQMNLLNSQSSQSAHTHFMATDAPERFARVGHFFLRNGLTTEDIELVDL